MNFRSLSSLSTKKTGETVANGTITQQVTRLKINNSSKLALQIVLGVMATFMVIAVKMVKIRGVLPRNPHSIASVMAFLAGLKLCDAKENIIPPGSEFLKKEELSQIFKDRRFGLGWWTLRDDRDVEEDGEYDEMELAAADESHTMHERHTLVNPRARSSISGARRFGIDVI
ncbi:hypothetical protein F4679DRAFT_586366 [Xylaria curta]|nr:hypothetical protein F4679DRAFT_586366 [Xylaria curta]